MKYILSAALALLVWFASSAQEEEKVRRPDIPGELMVDIGFNFWSSMPGGLERSVWKSKSIAFTYSKRKKFTDKLSLYYGAGIGLEKISLGDSATLLSRPIVDGVERAVYPSPLVDTVGFQKNRLAMTFLDIPLEFRFHPLGTEEGEGLFIGVGGMVGLRLKSYTKWKYDTGREIVKEKQTGRFDLNNIRYGYQVRAGYRGVHLFYKRYVSGVFRDPLLGFEPVMSTFGINVTGF